MYLIPKYRKLFPDSRFVLLCYHQLLEGLVEVIQLLPVHVGVEYVETRRTGEVLDHALDGVLVEVVPILRDFGRA